MISVYLLLDLQCSTISDMAEHHIFYTAPFRLSFALVICIAGLFNRYCVICVTQLTQ